MLKHFFSWIHGWCTLWYCENIYPVTTKNCTRQTFQSVITSNIFFTFNTQKKTGDNPASFPTVNVKFLDFVFFLGHKHFCSHSIFRYCSNQDQVLVIFSIPCVNSNNKRITNFLGTSAFCWITKVWKREFVPFPVHQSALKVFYLTKYSAFNYTSIDIQ